jgi:hypothetical protein
MVGGNFTQARVDPGLNGAKLRAIWDGSRPKGPLGFSRFQPGTQTHRLEAYATLLSGVSSDLSKCFLTGVPRARSDRATV